MVEKLAEDRLNLFIPMSKPTFKFANAIKELSLSFSCPDTISKPENYEVIYRYVSSDQLLEEDFLPQSVKRLSNGGKPPKRRLEENDEKWFCEEWALSLFCSLQKIRDFAKGNPRWQKKNQWFYIAAGPIRSSDGTCTEPDEKTHVNFFEYDGVDLMKVFKVIEEIK